MPRIALVKRHLLDARPADEAAAAPIGDAVNIPLAELPRRTHELPPRDEAVSVVGPAKLTGAVLAWLDQAGRRGVVERTSMPADHAHDRSIGRLWRPTAYLEETLPRLPVGRVLELACGTGRDAIFMASRGWRVTAVDVLPDALERARDLAARCAAAIEPVDWRVIDLERTPPEFKPEFDLIVGFRYLHRPLFAHLADWLKPGGSVVWETFTTTHRARHGRPAADAHVPRDGELPKLLRGYEIRRFSEAWRSAVHTARVWAVWAGSPPRKPVMITDRSGRPPCRP